MYTAKLDPVSTRQKRDQVNFAEQRYGEERVMYPWKDRPLGRKGLCLIYIYAGKFATDDQLLHKKPSQLDIKGKGMYDFVQANCPELFHDHRDVTGQELTPKKLMSRLANMFRNNKRRNFEIGDEHPKNHPALKPVLDEMLVKLSGRTAIIGSV